MRDDRDVDPNDLMRPFLDQLASQPHYNGTACLEAIESLIGRDGVAHSCMFNVLKYWWRIDAKGKPVEDAGKAHVYLVWWEERRTVVTHEDRLALERVRDLINKSSMEARTSVGAHSCLAIIDRYTREVAPP